MFPTSNQKKYKRQRSAEPCDEEVSNKRHEREVTQAQRGSGYPYGGHNGAGVDFPFSSTAIAAFEPTRYVPAVVPQHGAIPSANGHDIFSPGQQGGIFEYTAPSAIGVDDESKMTDMVRKALKESVNNGEINKSLNSLHDAVVKDNSDKSSAIETTVIRETNILYNKLQKLHADGKEQGKITEQKQVPSPIKGIIIEMRAEEMVDAFEIFEDSLNYALKSKQIKQRIEWLNIIQFYSSIAYGYLKSTDKNLDSSLMRKRIGLVRLAVYHMLVNKTYVSLPEIRGHVHASIKEFLRYIGGDVRELYVRLAMKNSVGNFFERVFDRFVGHHEDGDQIFEKETFDRSSHSRANDKTGYKVNYVFVDKHLGVTWDM